MCRLFSKTFFAHFSPQRALHSPASLLLPPLLLLHNNRWGVVCFRVSFVVVVVFLVCFCIFVIKLKIFVHFASFYFLLHLLSLSVSLLYAFFTVVDRWVGQFSSLLLLSLLLFSWHMEMKMEICFATLFWLELCVRFYFGTRQADYFTIHPGKSKYI